MWLWEQLAGTEGWVLMMLGHTAGASIMGLVLLEPKCSHLRTTFAFCGILAVKTGSSTPLFPGNDWFYIMWSPSSSNLNEGYYKKFFQECAKIGSGGFGSVFACRHVINGIDLGEYAIKKVPMGRWVYQGYELLQRHSLFLFIYYLLILFLKQQCIVATKSVGWGSKFTDPTKASEHNWVQARLDWGRPTRTFW